MIIPINICISRTHALKIITKLLNYAKAMRRINA